MLPIQYITSCRHPRLINNRRRTVKDREKDEVIKKTMTEKEAKERMMKKQGDRRSCREKY